MKREELQKAIDNGESVWVADKYNEKVWEIVLNEKYKPEVYLDQILYVYQNINDRFKQEFFIEDIYKTKAEAEHYLLHANISRIEHLPFLTWEEFKSGKNITFKAKNGHEFLLKAKQESIYLWWLDTNNIWRTWDLTEENFYKAYDECVRLFKGEE